MRYGFYAGDTDKTIYLRLRDSTTGLAKTGLAYNSAGAVASYTLPLAARAAITLATQTVTGAHSDGGFVEVDATNCKGLYRLDLPDAAIASGAFSIISIEFDGIIEESVEIELFLPKANVTQISDDATAADNCELMFDGTGYAGGTTRFRTDLDTIKGQAITCSAGVTVLASVGTAATSTAQTGDCFARLGAPAGASVSADVAAVKVDTAAILVDTGTTLDARIPAALVGGRMDASVGAMAANVLTAAATASDFGAEVAAAVWDLATSGHTNSGTFGEAMAAAGSAGDPWTTTLPGSYTSGQAGKILGDNLNATVSSRAVAGDAMALTSSERTTLAASIWNAATSGMTTAGSIGKKLADWTIHSAADVWAVATRVLTAATNITSTGGTTVPQTGDSYARLGAPAGASVSADVAAAKADTAAIKVVTDQFVFTVANRVDANARSVGGTSQTGGDLAALVAALTLYASRTVIRGTVGAATTPSTTAFTPSTLSPAGSVADQFVGRVIVFDNDTATAALRGQATRITASSAAALPLLTFVALTTAPASGDTFSIV